MIRTIAFEGPKGPSFFSPTGNALGPKGFKHLMRPEGPR